MADTRGGLTKASGITADVVMEMGAYFSAKQMRSVQTGLTTAARELREFSRRDSLLGRLGEKLSVEQLELLANAAALLESVKDNVEHAKERKVRAEKATAKKRLQWEREAAELVKGAFTLPTGTVPEQLRVLELHLVVQEVLGEIVFSPSHLELRKAMQQEAPRWATHSTARWHSSRASSLLTDVQTSLRYWLSMDLTIAPAQRLAELQGNLATRRDEILARPQSVETVRIWSEALRGAFFINSVMPTNGAAR